MALVYFFIPNAEAQKVKLVSGNATVLKGQTELNIQYTYEGMTVGKKDEQVYVKEKVAERNKSKAKDGETWAAKWVEDRNAKYHPKFEYTLNKALDKFKVKALQNASGATYTLIVKIVSIEPGYNIGISRQNAYLDVAVTIVDNTQKEIAFMTIDNCPPFTSFGGYDFDTGGRIAETFSSAGYALGNFLAKKVFK